jgi:release factor glutamine methyltransferase
VTGDGGDGRDEHLPGPGEPWTPILLTRWSGEYLRGKGVEKGRLDAELLLAEVLGVRRLDLYLQHDRPLSPRELEDFKGLLRRRAAREPIQYVLGRTAFRELELRTDCRALIPRPETEVLVGEVLSWARESNAPHGAAWVEGSGASSGPPGFRALDVGTGSGAIALSLLLEGPFTGVVATDPSPLALALARENASHLGLLDRLELREGRLFEPILKGERFRAIVSNPPYVPEGDGPSLQEEVRGWEPPGALFAGPEGLDVIFPLVEGAPSFLEPGGLLAVEVGEGQASSVVQAMKQTRLLKEIRIRPDLAGRERVVMGVASGQDLADLEWA